MLYLHSIFQLSVLKMMCTFMFYLIADIPILEIFPLKPGKTNKLMVYRDEVKA